MTYRILVVGEGKHFGLSTACLYVNLAGQCGETGVTEIPRGEHQCEVTVSTTNVCNHSNYTRAIGTGVALIQTTPTSSCQSLQLHQNRYGELGNFLM